MLKFSYLFIFGIILITSCTKIEGTGGTSALRGKVTGTEIAAIGKAEATDVICTNGASLEHGDYWLLNSANTAKYYYIYYVNPNWISDADPHLAGRVGIAVSFNYSDTNLEIAQKNTNCFSKYNGRAFYSNTRTRHITHCSFDASSGSGC